MSGPQLTGNYLADCRLWQRSIDEQVNLNDKSVVGEAALLSLRGRVPNGSRHVIVGADSALQIPDGSSPLEEQLWPMLQYGQIRTRGWLGRLNCIGVKGNVFL